MSGRELFLEIDSGPKCPKCGLDTFDDWHHEKGLKQLGSALTGRLKCHGCGRFFHIHRYSDGEVHSSMWRKVA